VSVSPVRRALVNRVSNAESFFFRSYRI